MNTQTQATQSPRDLFDSRMNELLARSATDMEFRSKLVASPRATMSEFLGAELPESFNIAIVENKADSTVVLPDPINVQAEIPEHELETVAGGATPLLLAVGATLAAAASLAAIYDAIEDKYCNTSCW